MPLGDANGFTKIAQGIFNSYMVALATEQKTNGRTILRVSHLIIHGGQIKNYFPGKFWLECLHLEINHDIAAESEVISGEFPGKSAALVVPLAISLANGPENAIFRNAPFDNEILTKWRKGWDSNPP